MRPAFRHAVCNELYGDWPFGEAMKHIRKAGYAGVEIAPFTLSEDPAAIEAGKRREYRSIMESEGLQFAGLHWLLAAPSGLHVTAPDKALRERSWEYIRRLIDLCADLGSGGVLVFGSPRQRGSTGGLSREEAARHFIEGLVGIAPHAAGRGAPVLVEALSCKETDVVNSLEEAVAVVREVGSPGVRTMFDTHNAVDETEPHAVLLERYFDLIRHVHVNELDGRHPGTGTYDFQAILEVLHLLGYAGWISLEAFDFTAGADSIASDSLHYLQSIVERTGA